MAYGLGGGQDSGNPADRGYDGGLGGYGGGASKGSGGSEASKGRRTQSVEHGAVEEAATREAIKNAIEALEAREAEEAMRNVPLGFSPEVANRTFMETIDMDDESWGPVVAHPDVVEDRSFIDAMLENNRAIEASQKEFETPLGLDFNPVPKDFNTVFSFLTPPAPYLTMQGTDIAKRTVEERSKKEQKEAEKQTYQQKHENNLRAYPARAKEIREQLEKEHEKEKKDLGKIRELNAALRAIEQSPQYSKAVALDNPALRWGAKILGGVLPGLSLGPTLEGYAVDAGFVDDTTPQQTIDAAKVYGGPSLFGATSEEPVTLDGQEGGGFWGLINFAKKNPEIFGSLSGAEIWALVSDPDAFWQFYEDALSA
jgi:hypothetical protein